MQNSFSRVPSSKICVLVPDAQILGGAARMLVSILSTISNLTQLISCQYILREVVVRQGGSVASLHLPPFPPSSLQPSSSRLVVRPSALSSSPFPRFAAPSCCWHVITQGSRPFLLSYFPCKKGQRLFPRLLVPTHHYLLKPPSLLYTGRIYDTLIVQKNHNPAHSAQALWGVNHLIRSVKLPSEGPSSGDPSGIGVRCYHGSLAAIFSPPSLTSRQKLDFSMS